MTCNALMYQESLHRIAGGGSLHFCVKADPFGHSWIGIGIDIDVTHAGVVPDDRDGRVLRNDPHQRFSAARDNQVDVAILLQQ